MRVDPNEGDPLELCEECRVCGDYLNDDGCPSCYVAPLLTGPLFRAED